MNPNHTGPDTQDSFDSTPDSFDHLLNATLYDRAQTEPLAGLESRILARVAAAAPDSPTQESRWPLWRWAALATTAAALCTAAFLAHQPHARRITSPQQTSAAIVEPSQPVRPDNGNRSNLPSRGKRILTPTVTTSRLATGTLSFPTLSSRSNAKESAVFPHEAKPQSEASLPKLDTFPSTSSEQTSARADQRPSIAIRVEVNPSSADKLEIAELKTTSIPITTMPTIQELP